MDTPSGVGVNDGSLPGPYIPATVTVTFGAMKPCAMVPPASYACGRLTLVDFGFDIDDCVPAAEMTDGDFVTDSIRLPQLSDGKYSRGVVGLVTGSARYPGAAVLSATAAARANTGMVRYLGPQRAQDMVLSSLPEAVIGKGRVQSWVVGSGVPTGGDEAADTDIQRETITALLKHYALQEKTGSNDDARNESALGMPPIVVDAGALDLLPGKVPAQVVVTPHVGELARMGVRLIALRCAGFNNVDLKAAAEHGITVVRVPAYSPYAVAEHAVALMLSLNRKVHRAYWRTRDGNFALHGLLGFDMTAKRPASSAREKSPVPSSASCGVSGWRSSATTPAPHEAFARESGMTYVPLTELYRRSDIISLHCPLTDRTLHMIDAASHRSK